MDCFNPSVFEVYIIIIHCKNVKVISTLTGLPQFHLSVQRFIQCACNGLFNPSWVLSVADVSIAELANLN